MIKMEKENSKARFLMKGAATFALLAGIFISGVGIGVIVAEEYHAAISSIRFQAASILLLVAGILSCLAGAIGFYLIKKFSVAGKPKQFLGILTVGAVCAIVSGVLAVVFISKTETSIQKDLHEKLRLYGVTGQYETLRNVDRVQEKDKCCGVINYADWRKTPYGGNRFDKVPDSCCKERKHACGFEFKDDAINKEGCLNKIKIRPNLLLVGVGGLLVGLIEVGLVIALVLSDHQSTVHKKRGIQLTSRNELPDIPVCEQHEEQEENIRSEDGSKATKTQTPGGTAPENLRSEDGSKCTKTQTPGGTAPENMRSEESSKDKKTQTPRGTSDRHKITPSKTALKV